MIAMVMAVSLRKINPEILIASIRSKISLSPFVFNFFDLFG